MSPNSIISSSQVSAVSVLSSPTTSLAHKGTTCLKIQTYGSKMWLIPMYLSADSGTWENAQWMHAGTSMCAANSKHNIKQNTVQIPHQVVVPNARWFHPAWTWGFIWSTSCPSLTPSAMAMETALPFPSVPLSKCHNTTALHTIASQLDIFEIVTMINVKMLNELLSTHPNHALINSVCLSLRNGVWPFLNIDPSAPETFNSSQWTLNADATQFTLEQ